jgi:MFS family permease
MEIKEMPPKTDRGGLHYGWIVAGVTFVTLLVTAGIRSTPGVLIVPLEQEFGWNRAIVSLAVSINLFVFGLAGPFAAATVERFGIRTVLLSAMGIACVAIGLTPFMQAAWQLYLLWGLFVGLAMGSGTGLAAIVANRWFIKRRGLVVGLLTASNATGQLVFLPLLATLVTSLGWRAGTLTTAGAALLLIPIVALLMRDRPRDKGLKPYGADETYEEPPKLAGNPFVNAVKALRHGLQSRDFLLLAGSFFICGATTNGLIGTHLIPAAMEHDIPEVTAAGLLATIGVFDIFGTTISGWLTDRWDSRWLLCWYYSLRGLSLLFLPYALGSSFFTLALFIVFYGLDWVATVPPTVRLTADVFGKAQVGIYFAWIMAAHQLGASVAAFGAGAIYSWLGSYQVSFWSAGLLCLIAAGLVIRIGRTSASKGKGRMIPVPEAEATVGD